jgi:hypothetical protein
MIANPEESSSRSFVAVTAQRISLGTPGSWTSFAALLVAESLPNIIPS